jgi:RNA polymerase sigma-70 factor (ECF subfamily)
MFAITENVWRSHLEMIKAKKRAAILVSLDQESDTQEGDSPPLVDRIPDPSPSPLESTLQQEKIEKLRTALQQLSPQRRCCLHLYVNEELSYQEIAECMELNVGTVKAHLHQAKLALREKLKTDFEELELLGRAAKEGE